MFNVHPTRPDGGGLAPVNEHQHDYTALWWHFGPGRDEDVHIHSCASVRCEWVLIGPGRDCDGGLESHRKERL